MIKPVADPRVWNSRRGLGSLALWTMKLGLSAFIAGEFMRDRREDALRMAIGVVASLVLAWFRLGHSWTSSDGAAPPTRARKGVT